VALPAVAVQLQHLAAHALQEEPVVGDLPSTQGNVGGGGFREE